LLLIADKPASLDRPTEYAEAALGL